MRAFADTALHAGRGITSPLRSPVTPHRPNPALANRLGTLGSDCYRMAAEINARGIDAGVCGMLDDLEDMMADVAARSDAARVQCRGETRAARVIEIEQMHERARVKKFKEATKDEKVKRAASPIPPRQSPQGDS